MHFKNNLLIFCNKKSHDCFEYEVYLKRNVVYCTAANGFG